MKITVIQPFRGTDPDKGFIDAQKGEKIEVSDAFGKEWIEKGFFEGGSKSKPEEKKKATKKK